MPTCLQVIPRLSGGGIVICAGRGFCSGVLSEPQPAFLQMFTKDEQWISVFLQTRQKLLSFAGLYLLWFGSAWSSGLLYQLNIWALNCKPVSTRRGQFCCSQRNALQICDLHSDVNNVLGKVYLSHSCHCERQSGGGFMCARRTVMLSWWGPPALQVNNTMRNIHKLKREGPKCFSVKLRGLILKMILLFSLQS